MAAASPSPQRPYSSNPFVDITNQPPSPIPTIPKKSIAEFQSFIETKENYGGRRKITGEGHNVSQNSLVHTPVSKRRINTSKILVEQRFEGNISPNTSIEDGKEENRASIKVRTPKIVRLAGKFKQRGRNSRKKARLQKAKREFTEVNPSIQIKVPLAFRVVYGRRTTTGGKTKKLPKTKKRTKREVLLAQLQVQKIIDAMEKPVYKVGFHNKVTTKKRFSGASVTTYNLVVNGTGMAVAVELFRLNRRVVINGQEITKELSSKNNDWTFCYQGNESMPCLLKVIVRTNGVIGLLADGIPVETLQVPIPLPSAVAAVTLT